MPASERYNSDRIEEIKQQSKHRGEKFAILSGKYGLLTPEEKIPYYDKILTEDRVSELRPKIESQLDKMKHSGVIYHTRPVQGARRPYFKVIKEACRNQNAEFKKKLI